MTNIPLGQETYQRKRASEPDIRYVNRYYETDPTDLVNGVAAIRRPGLVARIQVGSGPIRNTYWQSGFCDDDLFIVSKNELFRLHNTPTEGDHLTPIPGLIYGHGTPSMAARDDYLFIADGVFLQYTDGTAELTLIETPDDVVIVSITIIESYVICLTTSGRFYWIEPGEVTIDPLNFATLESQPDIGIEVMQVGDQFWGFGSKSTEPWYLTGDFAAPLAPVQGRPYDHGAWGGTPIKIGDEVILVGEDGRVYSVTSGADPISTPGIEERIAKAMKIQMLDI